MQQIIPPNWLEETKIQIARLDTLFSHATSVPPGEEFEKRWKVYEAACEQFVAGIEANFGTVEGFNEFLQVDARRQAEESGADVIEECLIWDEIGGYDPTSIAQNIGTKIEYCYEQALRIIENRVEIERGSSRESTDTSEDSFTNTTTITLDCN